MGFENMEKHELEHNHAVHEQGMCPLSEQTEDLANKALVDSLHFSFKILKVVMLLVVIAYLASGTFQVKPGQVAMVTRFGKVLGPDRELKQGLHWSWPWPIDQYILVPKGMVRSVDCNLWYQMTDQENGQGRSAMAGFSLVPGKDDYIITGDANIMHASITVYYGIVDAYEYVRNIPDAENWNPATNANFAPEKNLINQLAYRAMIRASGQFKTEELMSSDKSRFTTLIKQYLQQSLRSLNCGLEIKDVLLQKIEPPRQVINSFIEVRNATEQKHGDIQSAMGDATQLLTQTAGLSHEQLIQAIKKEQKLQEAGDPKLAEAQKEVSHLLEMAGGSVQEILADAKIYRTRTIESAKADANYFNALLPRYQENPRVVLSRLLLSTLEESLKNVRKWYMPKDVSSIPFMIDRDPEEMKETPVDNQQPAMAQPSNMPPGPPPGGPSGQ